MNTSSTSPYKIIVAILGVLIAGYLLWYFNTVVYYVLGAAAVSFIGGPLVKLLERVNFWGWRTPRWFSAMVVLIALLILFISLCLVLLPSLSDNVSYFQNMDSGFLVTVCSGELGSIDRWVQETFNIPSFSIEEIFRTRILPMFESGSLRGVVSGITTFALDFVMAIFCITFISYFFLKDDKLFSNMVVTLLPKRYEDNVRRAIKSSVTLLGRYFIGICVESLIKFVLVGFSLYFLGMNFSTAMIIGAITGALNVIPYIGPLIGAVIALAIGVLQPEILLGSAWEVVWEIAIVLGVFQLIDNIILQPYIYSSSVKAHPLEIFVVILMAGYAGGILGMLLAIPFYTVVRVFAKEFFANLRVVQKLTENL
ncbi:MAG: AI-2E family transporter [Rikenellaceae bacterium]